MKKKRKKKEEFEFTVELFLFGILMFLALVMTIIGIVLIFTQGWVGILFFVIGVVMAYGIMALRAAEVQLEKELKKLR